MSRKIRKAVFPVAGLGTRFLPATKAMPKEMLTVVDRPVIQMAVDEARAATGWPLKVAVAVDTFTPPTRIELETLRATGATSDEEYATKRQQILADLYRTGIHVSTSTRRVRVGEFSSVENTGGDS